MGNCIRRNQNDDDAESPTNSQVHNLGSNEEAEPSLPDNITNQKPQDHLSALANDCLIDILTRLDHNDLDELSTLSAKFCQVSEFSRNNAIKITATSFEIQQQDQQFHIKVVHETIEYYWLLNDTESALSSKMSSMEIKRRYYDDIPEPQENSEIITTRIMTELRRFAFQDITFQSISIDDHFLTLFEQLTSNGTERLYFSYCKFDVNISGDGKERFKSMLLVARPAELGLYFYWDIEFIDNTFLTSYIDSLPIVERINLYGGYEPLLYPEPDFAERLSKCIYFTWCCLVVNVDWLISSIMMRLRRERTGKWVFGVSDEIEEEDVLAALDPDLEYLLVTENRRRHHCHTITLPGTSHTATFQTRFGAYEPFILIVDVKFES